jgi:hypothetical protein
MFNLIIIVFKGFHVLLIKFVLKNLFYEPQKYFMQGILKGQTPIEEEYVLYNWYWNTCEKFQQIIYCVMQKWAERVLTTHTHTHTQKTGLTGQSFM